MKLTVLLFSMIITGILALSPADKNISGTWVMQTDNGACNPAVIRISMHEGVWEGKLDMPDQQVYDHPVKLIVVKGDSVFIKIAEDGNTIKAALMNDQVLEGVCITDNKHDAVRFTKI